MSSPDEVQGALAQGPDIIHVEGVSLGYGDNVLLRDMSFGVRAGEIFTVLGGSGCGKSTLLKALIGLLPPFEGSIVLGGEQITGADGGEALRRVRRRIGVLFQAGALLGSLTLGENVALPLEEFTDLPKELVWDLVRFKLQLVGLGSYVDFMPAELSGGMKKRAGLARAMALDPEILFCDEPSAGLDPVTAAELDNLLIQLNAALGVTIVVITHELASIDAISHRSLMLDREAHGVIALGETRKLKEESEDPRVQAFFHRKAPLETGA